MTADVNCINVTMNIMKTIFKTLGYTALGAITVLIVVYVGLDLFGTWHDEWSGYNASQSISDGVCNIAVIPIVGEITTFTTASVDEDGLTPLMTSMSDTLATLGKAETDPNIKGILTLIDSSGGSPSASMLIANGLENSSLPVASYILDMGASGGYFIATGADTVIASPFANVGSIGVTMSYLDYTEQNANDGLKFVSLSTGKFKDSGDPNKTLTAEERALFERDLKVSHDEFVKEVAENRSLPLEDVARLADGSTLPSSLALEHKLIDAIGDKKDVREWFAKQLDLSPEKVIFCQ